MAAPKFSALAETLIGSEIVKLGADIREKIAQGQEIFNFTIGDFDSDIFPIPAGLEADIIAAYRDHRTTYPPADGIAPLKKAIAAFIRDREQLEFSTDEILVAAGGRPLIYTAYRAIVDRGEKVIYAVPSWNNNHYVHFTEGEHVVIEGKLENNFMPTAAEIEPHLSGSSLLALCSPLNPTGTTFSREDLLAICDLVLAENERRPADAKKLYLLYDQIYWTLTYGAVEHYNPVSLRPAMKPYTIFIDGISKSFAATGVRVGWSLGPKELINKMKAINSHLGAWAPMAEQHAVAAFLPRITEVDAFFADFKTRIQRRLQLIFEGFQSLKAKGYNVDAVAPQAAIYLTIKIDLAGQTTAEKVLLADQPAVTAYLLDEAGLAIVPFTAFGAAASSCWYRLSVGTCKEEDIPVMLGRLEKALEKIEK